MAPSSSPTAPTPSPALFLSGQGGGTTMTTTEIRVVVHPLVLFHILDHHNRRNDAGSRVIGTLLGRRTSSSGDGDGTHKDDTKASSSSSSRSVVVEITNAFSVPHAERGEEVAIGKDFNKTMLQLHQRSGPRRGGGDPGNAVVGWYGTAPHSSSSDGADEDNADHSALIQDTSSLIHEFYATETEDGDPIHLVVDTRLLHDRLQIRAYRSTPIVLQGEVLGHLFHELPLSLHGTEPESIALRSMMESESESQAPEISGRIAAGSPDATKEALQVSLERLHDLVSAASDYVDHVVYGTLPADPVLGRELADAVSSVPSADSDAMDRLFHESLQDLLMVTYLSNITKTQVTIAEKLNAALG